MTTNPDEMTRIKETVCAWFAKSSQLGNGVVYKLLGGQQVTVEELDQLVEEIGKYQAFVICLRQRLQWNRERP